MYNSVPSDDHDHIHTHCTSLFPPIPRPHSHPVHKSVPSNTTTIFTPTVHVYPLWYHGHIHTRCTCLSTLVPQSHSHPLYKSVLSITSGGLSHDRMVSDAWFDNTLTDGWNGVPRGKWLEETGVCTRLWRLISCLMLSCLRFSSQFRRHFQVVLCSFSFCRLVSFFFLLPFLLLIGSFSSSYFSSYDFLPRYSLIMKFLLGLILLRTWSPFQKIRLTFVRL